MTEYEAIQLLSYHSQSNKDINNIKWERGFLGMLRPFTGILYEENYVEMLAIIDTLANTLKRNNIDREIISNLWAVCYFARLWGLENGGMLRRNNLLNDEQVLLLTKWVDDIAEKITLILLDAE